MLARRALTIPLYLSLTVLLTAFAPLLIILAWLIGRFPACKGAVPTVGLILGYFWCETIGIIASFYIWLRFRQQAAFLNANYRLQRWWANALKRIAEVLYRLTFEVSGTDALSGTGALLLPRHTSIADTLIPMVFYATPQQIRMRYVLKKELLLDPCLDVVGNRLPNYFVDRGGEDTAQAVAGVAELVRDMTDEDGMLLYPEGTRFSDSKVAALRRRWKNQPQLLAQTSRFPNLLPPRFGGVLAALDANPGKDVLFCAHIGFEGSSHFSNLINGSWRGARIRIHFWRVPFARIPRDTEARQSFLLEQWDQMNHWVSLLRDNEEPEQGD